MKFESMIEAESTKAARVITVDIERQKAFVEGARYTARYLMNILYENPMEDAAGVTNYLNKLRIKDVREALSVLLGYPKETT